MYWYMRVVGGGGAYQLKVDDFLCCYKLRLFKLRRVIGFELVVVRWCREWVRY